VAGKFLIGLTVLCWVVATAALWVIFASRRTGTDRRAAIHVIYRCREWSDLMKDFDRVSYERHLLARVLLRDPGRLYSDAIAKRMGWPR
jgi:hypothetical protein